MNKLALKLALFIGLFSLFNRAFGNDTMYMSSKDSSLVKSKNQQLRLALKYSSANTFYGRKDSVSIPLLSPSMRYTFANNIFVRTALIHTSTTEQIFDELDLELGYRFYAGEKWDFSTSFTRMFFSQKVSRLNSVANKDFNLYMGFDADLLYTALSFNYTSGSKTIQSKKRNISRTIFAKDYTLTWMNSRDFYAFALLNENDKVIFSPEIDVYFGTQNGIQFYRKKDQINSLNSNFNAKAIDFSLNMRYVLKQVSISLTPNYTIPLNVPQGDYSSPYFVFYGSVFYTLNF
jgi:hypothetical protein